jgi:hypothetical protein
MTAIQKQVKYLFQKVSHSQNGLLLVNDYCSDTVAVSTILDSVGHHL